MNLSVCLEMNCGYGMDREQQRKVTSKNDFNEMIQDL